MTKWISLGVIIDCSYSSSLVKGLSPCPFSLPVIYVTQINTSYVDLSSFLCYRGRITEKSKPAHSKRHSQNKVHTTHLWVETRIDSCTYHLPVFCCRITCLLQLGRGKTLHAFWTKVIARPPHPGVSMDVASLFIYLTVLFRELVSVLMGSKPLVFLSKSQLLNLTIGRR